MEGLILHNPSRRIVLLVRQPFALVPALFPKPPHDVLALDFEPHRETVPDEKLKQKLQALVRQVHELDPFMVIVADLEPSWLSWFLVAVLPEAKPIGLPATEAPRGLLRVLAKEFGGEVRAIEGPRFQEGMHEHTRYEKLLSFLSAPVPAIVASLDASASHSASGN